MSDQENIPPLGAVSKSKLIIDKTSSRVAVITSDSKKPFASPIDLNNSDQWRERNVVITSHEHQENRAAVEHILDDLLDNLPCFQQLNQSTNKSAVSPNLSSLTSEPECDSGLASPSEATELLKSLENEELDEFSECVDSLNQNQPALKETSSAVDIIDINLEFQKPNPETILLDSALISVTGESLPQLETKAINEELDTIKPQCTTVVEQLSLENDELQIIVDSRVEPVLHDILPVVSENIIQEETEVFQSPSFTATEATPDSLSCLAKKKVELLNLSEKPTPKFDFQANYFLETLLGDSVGAILDQEAPIQETLKVDSVTVVSPSSFSNTEPELISRIDSLQTEINNILSETSISKELPDEDSEKTSSLKLSNKAEFQETGNLEFITTSLQELLTETEQKPNSSLTQASHLELGKIENNCPVPEPAIETNFTEEPSSNQTEVDKERLSFSTLEVTNSDYATLFNITKEKTPVKPLVSAHPQETDSPISENSKELQDLNCNTLPSNTDHQSPCINTENLNSPLATVPKLELDSSTVQAKELSEDSFVANIQGVDQCQSELAVLNNFSANCNLDCQNNLLVTIVEPLITEEISNSNFSASYLNKFSEASTTVELSETSTTSMPTPAGETGRDYEGNEAVHTDYVNDNVQNSSFLISGDKPKMELDENINPFETRSKLGSKSEQNENEISQHVTNTTFECSESSDSPRRQTNLSPLPAKEPVLNDSDGLPVPKIINQEEDEGVTFDSEKDNLMSAATAFEDYAENLDSGICDHIEPTRVDAKQDGDIGVASVNRRTFRKSTPSLPNESNPASPSHSNLINETLSGTSSPDLSLGASAPLVNQSEAGPEVAQFTEDEFRSAAEVFKDPADFDFLLRAGSSKVLKESTLSRLSLYVKFDPLVKVPESPVKNIKTTEARLEVAQPSDIPVELVKTDQLDISVGKEANKNLNSSKLIEFESPKNVKAEKSSPKMVPVEPVQRLEHNQSEAGKFFTEEDMKKALQIHDLLYQERLLKKEKEGTDKEQSFKAEITELQRHVKLQAECLSCARKLLHETTRMSKLWREKKEQDRVEQTKERDQALEDLQSVETAFGDLHKRYEKTKAVLEGYKQKENELREELLDCQDKLKNQEQMYEALRARTEEQLDSANIEIESARKSGSSDLAILSAQLKKSEMKVASLERTLVQKEQEFEELSRVYDDLIARFDSQRT